jgi:hypothetical protein
MLTLSLFIPRILLVNHIQFALASDDLTISAAFFYGCFNFHFLYPFLFSPVGTQNPAPLHYSICIEIRFCLLSNRRVTFPISPCLQAKCGYSASSSSPKYAPAPHVHSPIERETSHWIMLLKLYRLVLLTFASPLI